MELRCLQKWLHVPKDNFAVGVLELLMLKVTKPVTFNMEVLASEGVGFL